MIRLRFLLASVAIVSLIGAMVVASNLGESGTPSALAFAAPTTTTTTTTEEPDLAALVDSAASSALPEEELQLTAQATARATSTTTTVASTTTTSAPPTTAPSTTASPTTSPPSTAAPTTSPPTTSPPSTAPPDTVAAGYVSSAESDFAGRVNSFRGSNGLSSLSRDGSLDAYARNWAEKLAGDGGLSHSSLSSLFPPWSVAGENVGVGGSVGAIFEALVDSPGHRDTMLSDFTHLGVGVYRDPSGVLWTAHVFTR